MALSVALPLSGLETESFSTFSAFGIKNIFGISQDSPSPSASSESSGLGSLGSIPPSPHDNDKTLFAVKSPVPEMQVQYGGRNILDLRTNIDPAGWKLTYSHLPPNNPPFFLNNRSQYYRLGGYAQVDFDKDTCSVCGFESIAN
ncbi:uncharacterized protein LOC143919664 [Arctopsyche grandis]|uniref:uncharacterized protein LOC143919664 n=1 Tax=Arctopsyche grandis TaxID=121162 RepID=UPI00406D6F40